MLFAQPVEVVYRESEKKENIFFENQCNGIFQVNIPTDNKT